ncbi:hypothetical protein LIER_11604 [Lithospermum erythrorhizon]|uniref:Uncharacterized protein n=1 Tax=Lithospermum erythrorhizon TaxID=34254 RepID=A0AAV3PTS5_LITER
MGCTASKLENEDTVRRCKERRRLMKEAVHARHHLSAAHFDYCLSLRHTGAALSSFAAGEPLSVSHHTPAVLLRSTTTTTSNHGPPPPPQKIHHPPPQNLYQSPAPPPPQNLYHSPAPPPPQNYQFSATPPPEPPVAPPVAATQIRRKKQPIKLPHILSDSSPAYTPKKNQENFTFHARANSTFSNTPSQTESSVWNWENFYPPSPPDSEYFQQIQSKRAPTHDELSDFDDKASNFSNKFGTKKEVENVGDNDDEDQVSNFSSYSRNTHKSGGEVKKGFENLGDNDDDKVSNFSSYSRYTHKSGGEVKQGKIRAENSHWEGEETEREEVQCSEWGDHDHYSTTSSSDVEGDDEEEEGDYDDLGSRSDLATRSNFGSVTNESVLGGGVKQGNESSLGGKYQSKLEKLSDDGGSSSMSWGYGKGNDELVEDRRMVVRHKDLVEIVAAIKEYFDKAAAAGEQASELLETGSAQLRQLKKTVYHSSGLLSNLSSTWSSKPPLAVKYRFEPSSIELAGGPKSLSSTLERLFAWEKKLYEEVKAREGVKIAHEKKLSTLQSQEAKGEEEAKLEKTKTSINKLQSLILVTSQAVSTTSTAIVGLRDSELVPQLVELCHGFMYMWRSMNQFHEVQNDIVQQVRGLVNQSNKGVSTSDLHRQATRDLESSVSAWHSSFCRLIKFQRDFIRSLHGWFKLSLVPVNNLPNEVNREPSEAFGFCDEWKLALDRVPDTVASEAIKSFVNVVHSISAKQTEELKIKKRTESASKELEKKASSLRNIEKKYYNTYSMVGIGMPDSGPENGHALDARDPLVEKKAELAACQRRVEDEMLKHSRSVEVTRAMTLNNIQTGLPGVFQALTSFSSLFMEALETVCTRSYAITR